MLSEPFVLSGRAPRFWMLPLIAVPSALASAFVYAWIDVYSPIAGYVSILFVWGLAMGASLPVAFAGRLLRIRSTNQMRVAGALTGLLTLYFAWVFFAWVFIRREATDPPSAWFWMQTPAALWDFAQIVGREGWYKLNGIAISGIVLWILWAMEAVIVVGAGFVMAPTGIAGEGFCEDCDTWMTEKQHVVIPVVDGQLAGIVRKQGLAGVLEVQPPSTRQPRTLDIRTQRCPRCRQAAVYRVDDTHTVKTDKGTRKQAMPLLPLSWMRAPEQTEFDRITSLLAAADEARFAALKKNPAS